MSGKYSLNTFGNIIKYDNIRSNIGLGVDPDIYARLKVNSSGSGESSYLWISSLLGGYNDNLNKVAIGTINSNSCVGAVNKLYNFTDLYLNSDTTYNNYGDIYVIGNVINSNNFYIHSNLNVNGNVGIGKYSSKIRLDVDGNCDGTDINNWICASIGSANNNLGRIAIGVLNSNVLIGSYDKIWRPLLINGDGNGNGCNVTIGTNLFINSNLSVLNGNIIVNSGPMYSNAIFIGTYKNYSSIYSYNNYTKDYNELYLNGDIISGKGSDVHVLNSLNVYSNIKIYNNGNLGIGTSYSSNKLHIYNTNNITGDVGIIIENKNTTNNKNITSIKLNNDTLNGFNIYLNSSKGGIYENNTTSNTAVLINNAGPLLLKTKNNKGISIYEDSSVILDSNLQVINNVGVGKIPSSLIRFDVLGYGTGMNSVDWVSGKFSANTSTNSLVAGIINNYPCIAGYNNLNNWTPLVLNGNGQGSGADVIIDKNLLIGSNIIVTSNLFITGSLDIGNLNATGRMLTVYGGITTVGNDISNGLIKSSGGILATGGNIILTSSGGLNISGGTGASISGSLNSMISSTNNIISASLENRISSTNIFITGSSSNCISSPNTSILGNLAINTGSSSGKLDVSGLITGYNGLVINGTMSSTSGLTVNSGGILASGGINIAGSSALSGNTNTISSLTSTTLTGPLIINSPSLAISGSSTTITNTASILMSAPNISITTGAAGGYLSIESSIGIGTTSVNGNINIGSVNYPSKTLSIYGNIEIIGTNANNGNITIGNGLIIGNGLTISSGDFTLSTGNLIISAGSTSIGNNLTVGNSITLGAVSQSKTLLVYGNVKSTAITVNSDPITGNIINAINGGVNILQATGSTNTITATTNTLSASTNVINSTTTTNITGTRLSIECPTTNSGGLTLSSGDLILNSGRISCTGSITSSGGLTLNGGNLYVNTGSISCATGLSILAGGLTVSYGGLNLTTGNLYVSAGTISCANGLSVSSGGLTVVSGNLSISSGSISCSSGLTVSSGDSIFNNGTVTIGTTTDQLYKLNVGGNIKASGDIKGDRLFYNSIDTDDRYVTSNYLKYLGDKFVISIGGNLTNAHIETPYIINPNVVGNLTMTSGNIIIGDITNTPLTEAQSVSKYLHVVGNIYKNGKELSELYSPFAGSVAQAGSTGSGKFVNQNDPIVNNPTFIGTANSCNLIISSNLITSNMVTSNLYVHNRTLLSGNVGINTSINSSYDLDVKGYINSAKLYYAGTDIDTKYVSLSGSTLGSVNKTLSGSLTLSSGNSINISGAGKFVGDLTGNCSGSSASCTGASASCGGNALTATTATNLSAGDKTIDGNITLSANKSITLSGTGIFVGNLSGNALTATTATTATNLSAGDKTIDGDITLPAGKWFRGDLQGSLMGYSTSCTGNAETATTATNLSAGNKTLNGHFTLSQDYSFYVSGNGRFRGNLEGSCSGSSASCTGNAASASSAYGGKLYIGNNFNITEGLKLEDADESILIFQANNTTKYPNSYFFMQQSDGHIYSRYGGWLSDIRIKKNITDITNDDIINKFLMLKPKLYNKYIDKDIISEYGLIANDVENIFPEVIDISESDYIPNIFSNGIYDSYNNTIIIDKDISTILNINDKIKVVYKKKHRGYTRIGANNNSKYELFKLPVTEILTSNIIKVDNFIPHTEKYGNNIFIYGTEVTDLKTLNYNSLFTINIAATQNLYSLNQSNIIKIQNLTSTIENQNKIIYDLEKRLLNIETKLNI